MFYDNFEINVGPGENHRYPVRGESATAGETGTVSVAIDPSGLHSSIEAIAQRQVDRELLKAFGARLYDLLVPTGPIRDLFHRSLGNARQADRGLRILLAIEPPQIAAIPWEYLYDSQRRHWFATSTETLLVRYPKIPVELKEFCVKPPFRMLFIAPQSSGLASDREREKLEAELSRLQDTVKLHWLDRHVTMERIRETLVENEFHVIHFVGHAEFRQNGEGQGYVRVDADSGGDRAIAGEDFAKLFQNQSKLKLVFLNACEGASVSSVRPLVGIAPELLYRGVPAVIGLQFRVFDDVAITFAKEFYATLFRGPKRGLVDVAITEARNFLAAEYSDDDEANCALGEPVLFLHAGEGMLYLVESDLMASSLSRAEVQLNQHADDVVRRRDDVTVDSESRARVARYVRRRNLLRRVMLGAITVVLSILAARGALKVLGLDRAIQDRVVLHIWASEPSAESENLILVTADEHTKWDKSWRERHARLIRKLTAARAAMIVFDVEFCSDGDPNVDGKLAEAMKEARERGIHIVAIADDLASSTDVPDAAEGSGLPPDQASGRINDDRRPHVASAVRAYISGCGVSFVPLGDDGRVPTVPRAALWFFAEYAPDWQVGGVPGLAFAAFCRHLGVDLLTPEDIKGSISKPSFRTKTIHVRNHIVRFVNCDEWHLDDRASRIRSGDTVIQSLYRIVQHRRVAYEDVLDRDAAELSELRGKVIFVGPDHDTGDQYMLSNGQQRAGVRLHADIFHTLCAGAIGRMPAGVEFVLLLVMAAIGAWVGGATRWSVLTRCGIVSILLAGYCLAALLVMIDTRLIFDLSYPAFALILVFLVNMWSEDRWYQHAAS